MLFKQNKTNSAGFKEAEINHNSNIPLLYEAKENCCGCTACFAACPTNAITMKPDDEGFLYPVINEEKCVRCYRCIKVCTFKKDQSEHL